VVDLSGYEVERPRKQWGRDYIDDWKKFSKYLTQERILGVHIHRKLKLPRFSRRNIEIKGEDLD
jgi:hypothetical protein